MDIYDFNSTERSGARLFKEGDTVYIRPDLRVSDRPPCIVENMITYANEKDTIKQVKGFHSYTLSKTPYSWADWMLLSEQEYFEMAGPVPTKTDILSMF